MVSAIPLFELVRTSASARDQLDQALALAERDRARVEQLTAPLETARLGARDDRIAAAERLAPPPGR